MARLLPVPVTALPRAADRMSFLYLEHCVVHREDGALTARNEQGMMRVPAASLLAVFLGPGTSISHQAMMLLGECGTTAVWVGERGVRYYAHGRSLATSTRLLVEQAARVSSPQKRLGVARQMYLMRFAGEDVTGLTMQQLRGREGATSTRQIPSTRLCPPRTPRCMASFTPSSSHWGARRGWVSSTPAMRGLSSTTWPICTKPM